MIQLGKYRFPFWQNAVSHPQFLRSVIAAFTIMSLYTTHRQVPQAVAGLSGQQPQRQNRKKVATPAVAEPATRPSETVRLVDVEATDSAGVERDHFAELLRLGNKARADLSYWHRGPGFWGEQAAHAAQPHQQAEQETLDVIAGREAAYLQEQPQHGGVPSLQ